ncbi:uncharacterized protein LOC119376782 [Rhipicephalus sanguineus]|uniref:uncharacterized protein LOC119376782 n=1 Tax=Rhipicephalus sanguineus TaxID=34632 RepID=UPI0020C55E0A|nr:uncharacterized protein LOC119376782 [Rhipicephalus sanguineus]
MTRSQRADGTSEDHELDRDEASVNTDSAHVRAVESADPAVQVRVKELEIEALKLQIELQKLKLQSHASNEVGRSDRCGLARYADQLRAVLPPMPVSDELVPAWFRSAENMLRSCEIPDEVQGAIIVPFLNENSRTLVANRADDRVLSYHEVRDLILHELKLTPEEYKRRLYACRKGDETWGQFATRLEILLDYYLRSREVSNVQELRALIISDRVKQLMREDMRTYVLQHETAEWLRPHELVKLAQKYDESTSNRKSGKTANGSSKNGERFDRRTSDRLSQGTERTGVRCYACGESGHYRWQCSQTTPPPAEQGQDRFPRERLAARDECQGCDNCAITTEEMTDEALAETVRDRSDDNGPWEDDSARALASAKEVLHAIELLRCATGSLDDHGAALCSLMSYERKCRTCFNNIQ